MTDRLQLTVETNLIAVTMLCLRIVFIAQLLLMLAAFAFLIAASTTIYTALLYLYLVPVGLIMALFALWRYIKHPARRPLALATGATPVLCLGLPFGILALNGGPVAPALLITATVLLIVGAVFVLRADRIVSQSSWAHLACRPAGGCPVIARDTYRMWPGRFLGYD